MTLPATDNFTAANGTDLVTYNASWTYNGGVFAINSNAVYSNSAGIETGAHWNADAFNNDQYAQGVCAIIAALRWIGVAVRCHASAQTYYGYYGSNADRYLFKEVAATWTQIGSAGGAFIAADVIRLEVSGTTLTPKLNGSTDATIGAQTDSAISSGSAGISGSSLSTVVSLDDWEGGNLGAAAGAVGPLLDGHLVKHSILQGRLV